MKAKLFEKLDNKKVRCLACSHYCKIPERKTGICGIRKNKDGELYLLTYGKPTGLQIDPIEKKPLYHFLPGSNILSLGTIGCNFSCGFCQNWPTSQKSKTIGLSSLEKILNAQEKITPKMVVNIAKEEKIPSIAFTYNEPSVFFEYAFDIAKLAHKNKIKTVFVSNGFMSKELLDMIYPYLDGINIDLKSFSDNFYRKICRGRIKPVLENIKKIHELGIWMEITTLVIPGKNDSGKELTEIADFISKIDKSIPWHLTSFHPNFRMDDIPNTPMDTLLKGYEIGKKKGLNYVYIGNVMDKEHEKTFCPKCKNLVIERDYNAFTKNYLKDGFCQNCNEKIKGVWK